MATIFTQKDIRCSCGAMLAYDVVKDRYTHPAGTCSLALHVFSTPQPVISDVTGTT